MQDSQPTLPVASPNMSANTTLHKHRSRYGRKKVMGRDKETKIQPHQ